MLTFKKNKIAILLAAMALTACGGGGSSSDEPLLPETPEVPTTPEEPAPEEPTTPDPTPEEPTTPEPEPEPIAHTVSGTVLTDSYAVDATVCLDQNLDGQCSDGEMTTSTDSQGQFVFELTAEQFATAGDVPLVAEIGSAVAVQARTLSVSAAEPEYRMFNIYPRKGSASSPVISPNTHKVSTNEAVLAATTEDERLARIKAKESEILIEQEIDPQHKDNLFGDYVAAVSANPDDEDLKKINKKAESDKEGLVEAEQISKQNPGWLVTVEKTTYQDYHTNLAHPVKQTRKVKNQKENGVRTEVQIENHLLDDKGELVTHPDGAPFLVDTSHWIEQKLPIDKKTGKGRYTRLLTNSKEQLSGGTWIHTDNDFYEEGTWSESLNDDGNTVQVIDTIRIFNEDHILPFLAREHCEDFDIEGQFKLYEAGQPMDTCVDFAQRYVISTTMSSEGGSQTDEMFEEYKKPPHEHGWYEAEPTLPVNTDEAKYRQEAVYSTDKDGNYKMEAFHHWGAQEATNVYVRNENRIDGQKVHEFNRVLWGFQPEAQFDHFVYTNRLAMRNFDWNNANPWHARDYLETTTKNLISGVTTTTYDISRHQFIRGDEEPCMNPCAKTPDTMWNQVIKTHKQDDVITSRVITEAFWADKLPESLTGLWVPAEPQYYAYISEPEGKWLGARIEGGSAEALQEQIDAIHAAASVPDASELGGTAVFSSAVFDETWYVAGADYVLSDWKPIPPAPVVEEFFAGGDAFQFASVISREDHPTGFEWSNVCWDNDAQDEVGPTKALRFDLTEAEAGGEIYVSRMCNTQWLDMQTILVPKSVDQANGEMVAELRMYNWGKNILEDDSPYERLELFFYTDKAKATAKQTEIDAANSGS